MTNEKDGPRGIRPRQTRNAGRRPRSLLPQVPRFPGPTNWPGVPLRVVSDQGQDFLPRDHIRSLIDRALSGGGRDDG